jgi:hypothetical protein
LKSYNNGAGIVSVCPRSLAIPLVERYTGDMTDSFARRSRTELAWLVSKGDLLSDSGKQVEREIVFTFQATDRRRHKLPVYEYSDDYLPVKFENAQHGEQSEITIPKLQVP